MIGNSIRDVVSPALVSLFLLGCSPGSSAYSGANPDASPSPVSSNDGTTGQPCTSDAMCRGANGPGTNVCSNGAAFVTSVTNVQVELWPTPVCLKPEPAAASRTGNCDPAPPADPSGQFVHFCDGPDVSTSPGICIPFASDSTPRAGRGICYPQCNVIPNGGATTGCAGHDSCVFYAYDLDAKNALIAYGYCQGGCERTSDCSALGPGYDCQTDIGFCTNAKRTRAKNVGDACSLDDWNQGACNCAYGASGNGYCTVACIAGGTACPSGWVCDTGEFSPVTFDGVSASFAVAIQNTGLAGTCAPACALLDAGIASSDAAIASSDAGSIFEAGVVPLDGGSASDGAITGDAPEPAVDDSSSETSPGGEAEDLADDVGSPDAAATGSDAAGTADVFSGVPAVSPGCPASSVCQGGSVVGPDCVSQ